MPKIPTMSTTHDIESSKPLPSSTPFYVGRLLALYFSITYPSHSTRTLSIHSRTRSLASQTRPLGYLDHAHNPGRVVRQADFGQRAPTTGHGETKRPFKREEISSTCGREEFQEVHISSWPLAQSLRNCRASPAKRIYQGERHLGPTEERG